MAFETRDLTPRIATEIRASKAELLSGEYAKKIRELLEQRGVLVFPKIDFNDEEQVAFTNTLGTFAPEHDGEIIYKVTLDTKVNAKADYLKGSWYWHIDGTMNKVPVLASILCAKVLTEVGGETEFCNTYAAYDDLPDADKAEFEKLLLQERLAGSSLLVFANKQVRCAARRHGCRRRWRRRGSRSSRCPGRTTLRMDRGWRRFRWSCR